MNSRLRLFDLTIGLGGLLLLAIHPQAELANMQTAPLLTFIVLSILIKRSGIHVAPHVTHSLVGVVDLAAILLFGPVPGGLVAVISEFVYLALRAWRRGTRFPLIVELPLFNAGLKAIMAVAADDTYALLGGRYAPTNIDLTSIVPLTALVLVWFGLDHLGWALRAGLEGGWPAVQRFVRAILIPSLLVELFPLPFALVIAVVYAGLGEGAFALLAVALVTIALVIQRLAEAQTQLRARVAELTVFDELGRAIVQAQMDVEQLLTLGCTYARRVVPAPVLALELLEPEAGQVRLRVWDETSHQILATSQPMTPASSWMNEHRHPVLVQDTQREFLPFSVEYLGSPVRSAMAVPLLAGQKLTGVMLLGNTTAGAFREDHLRALSALVNELAVAIENARLYEREWQRAVQLSAISEVSRQVATILDLDQLLNRVVQLIKDSFGYDHVFVYTVDHGAQEAVFRAGTSGTEAGWCYRVQFGQGLIGWVAAHGEPLLVNDVSTEPRYRPGPDTLPAVHSELVVPLKVEHRILGVLDVESTETDAFDKDDLFVLQTLADQIAIAVEDARLYQEALERQRMEEELRVARGIQSSLLPERPPSIPGWDIATTWQPAREVAGDFFDFVQLQNGHWGCLIADVSDKGMPAALFMAMARSVVRTTILGPRPPADALERANELILRDTRADMFLTMFYLILDPATGQISYVNAGHNPPLIFRQQSGTVQPLHTGGVVLGAVPNIKLTECHDQMDPGDCVLLYTDGIVEAINARDEAFGEERLAEVLATHASLTAVELVDRIRAAVLDFTAGQAPADDMAVIVITRETSNVKREEHPTFDV